MIARPRGRDLSPQELEDLARGLAAWPQFWARHVSHDPQVRVYEEILRDEHVSVWLICWMHDHDTGFHDHDRSAAGIAVARGAVREDRLCVDGPAASRVVRAGGSLHVEASAIHRVLHAGETPAVTIHAYSPPLDRMGAYEVGPGGRLERHAVGVEHELRAAA